MLRQLHKTATPLSLLLLVVYVHAAVRPPYASAQSAEVQGELVPLPANYAEGLHDEAALQALSEYFEQTAASSAAEAGSGKSGELPELSEDEAQRELAALPKGGGTVSAQAAALPSGAATQLGMGESFSTQLSTGGAAYGLPLMLPSARGTVQPRLDVTYNSAGGFGIAGVGWNIGASAISRQGDRGVPRYDDRESWHPEQDRFLFGGSELVPVCDVTAGLSCPGALETEVMPAWAAGWQYFRSRIESGFLRFFWSADHRTWRVQGRDGSNIELGVPLDGSGYEGGLEANPDRAHEIYRWHMTRQYDSQGDVNKASGPEPVNVIYYRYLADGNSRYLTDIYDTSPAVDPMSNDLSTFAHHTRLEYEARPDPMVSYRAGYRAEYTLRLSNVDVTSKPFSGSVADPRSLVRRYHFNYDPDGHRSLLTSAQMEGRCDSPVLEGPGQGLPRTSCARMPPMKFGYERIEGVATAQSQGPLRDGQGFAFDPFVETVEALENSPPHSLDEALTSLMDVNADGLPDVLVTAPGLFGGNHGLFPNGLDPNGFFGFSRSCTMVVEPAGDVLDAGGLMLNNANVTPLDLDGDGLLDLIHMPAKKRYSVFRLKNPFTSDCPDWEGREVLTADGQDVKIDFTRDSPDTQVMDVNGDGLVDIVYSSPTEIQTFYALGRYPGGADRFGQATWTGPDSADLSTEPVTSCAPWSAQPVQFSDSDTRVADMNGDGLPDIVRLRAGQVLYWPGRGNGFWGTGDRDDCGTDGFAVDRHVVMFDAPHFGTTLPGALQLNDINGDGLADLVEFRNQGVDIYLNDNGQGFTERHVIADTPFLPSDSNYVRLTDIDGSGTPDIVWGRAYEYQYIDLTGGKTPHLLTQIENGLGKTMTLEYQSSAQHMLQAQQDGEPWSLTAPVVMPVLVRTTVTDNLDKVGRPQGVHETQYKYRDPVYDGRQREFRGFREAITTVLGDASSPTVHQRTVHHLGECPTEFIGTAADVCSPQERYKDNWREALKGTPILSETFDDRGVYLSTVHPTIKLRQLYTGLDGRRVVAAMPYTQHVYSYDSAATGPNALGAFDGIESQVNLPDVMVALDGIGVTESRSITLRAQAGRVKVESTTHHDDFGNVTLSVQPGCVQGCPSGQVDEVLSARSSYIRPAGDESGWLYREHSSYLMGSNHLVPGTNDEIHYNQIAHTFNRYGQLLSSVGALSGTLPLDRQRLPSDDSGSLSIAPTPVEQSGGQGQTESIELIENTYDEFGHVIAARGPNNTCSEGDLDPLYAQLPIQARTFAGDLDPVSGCGDRVFSNEVTYDRGLEAPLSSHSLVPNGAGNTEVSPGRVVYDNFGRPVEIYGPMPGATPQDLASQSADFLAARMQYILPSDASSKPYSVVITEAPNGGSFDAPIYSKAYAFIDGLDRPIASLSPADPDHCDGGDWVASSDGIYNRKGMVINRCRPEFYSGSPLAFPLAGPRLSELEGGCDSTEYDAFGRAVNTYALDGKLTSHVEHHALSQDAYDANDMTDNTYATVIGDGHGRGVKQIVRIRNSGVMEERVTKNEFLPTGHIEQVVMQTAGQADVTRWMRYDSFGRMVLNVEPNTTVGFTADLSADESTFKAIRYAYNDAGQIVGNSDARGCGANYHYDAGGRMVAVDRSPCEAHHPDYTAPNLSTGTGTEGFYKYDYADSDEVSALGAANNTINLWGRLASVSGPGSKGLYLYDGLGRTVASAAKMVKPGPLDASLSTRYAPRWYKADADFDVLGRPTRTSSGVPVDQLKAANGTSELHFSYSKRGAVYSLDSSYGNLYQCVSQEADGRPVAMQLGDAAQTTRHYIYDERLAVQRVMTDRSAVPLWSDSTYDASFPTGADTTQQLLIEDYEYFHDYDVSAAGTGNIVKIVDKRIAADWPVGSKPVNREFEYDDLYRMTGVAYAYDGGGDEDWTSPFEREVNDANARLADPNLPAASRPEPAPHVEFDKRIKRQDYQYDWLGNISESTDDAQGFWDRSTGTRSHGSANVGPHQLQSASGSSGNGRGGDLDLAYDAGGNVTDLIVRREGPCAPEEASCYQRFSYRWDELGQLVRARRWDLFAGSEQTQYGVLANGVPSRAPDAELRYHYDGGGNRVLKTAIDKNDNERHTVYVSGAIELRSVDYVETGNSGEYDFDVEDATRVSLRLPAGFATARVLYSEQDLPDDDFGASATAADKALHVFLELSDHLGSSSVILDHETGELVEFATYQAYGATESDYRPGRWDNFREEYKFSGKEEDIEVGLQYFGARFYSPYLGVWLSPDPVTIHDLGSDPNPYSYVGGRPVMAVDPDGRAVFTLGGLAIAAVIGAVVAAATSIVVQAASNGWDFTKIDWGINGVLGQALVGAVTAAVTFGVGAAASSVGSVAKFGIDVAVGASISATNYGVQSAMSGSSVTVGGFLTAAGIGAAGVGASAIGGAVSGAFRSVVGCGFVQNAASTLIRTGATGLIMAGVTQSWDSKSFAISMGMSMAAAAASGDLGKSCFTRGTRVTKGDGERVPIEEVELGERVLPGSEVCEGMDVSEWQRYEFLVEGDKPHHADDLNVALLRPDGWQGGVDVGTRIWLDLEELGIQGWARLLSRSRVGAVDSGAGCPVTGTFTGLNASVMVLGLEGESTPLELTQRHRLFSVTRGDWVPAVELKVGEELQTLDGVVRVAARDLRARGVERVFNLEVAGVHAFYVGVVGVLAHNQSVGECAEGDNGAGMSRDVREPDPAPPDTKSYLVARDLDILPVASHMFVAADANYVGDPGATVFSYGQSSLPGYEGQMGPVNHHTKGLSATTAAGDLKYWKGLSGGACGNAYSGVQAVQINADSSTVVTNAQKVLNPQPTYRLAPVGGAVNSNSAAQAIADRSQGSSVPRPGPMLQPAPGNWATENVNFHVTYPQ